MSLQTNNIYEFEDFRLDLAQKILLRDGKSIPLTPKVFETLCVLVENAGHLIEKDELRRRYCAKVLPKAVGKDFCEQ